MSQNIDRGTKDQINDKFIKDLKKKKMEVKTERRKVIQTRIKVVANWLEHNNVEMYQMKIKVSVVVGVRIENPTVPIYFSLIK